MASYFKEPLQSVEAGEARAGEGAPRRLPSAKDALINVWDPEIQTAYDVFEAAVKAHPRNNCLGRRTTLANGKGGPFTWETYEDIHRRRNNIGSGLASLGHKTGQAVGIYSINRPEWLITDLACSAYGWPSIALYDTLGKDAVVFILNHAEIALAVCAGKQLDVFLAAASQCDHLKTVVCFDEITDEQRAKAGELKLISLAEVEAAGAETPVEASKPTADDLYTIMYTSGTTGNPKGVILTHGNFVAELTGVRNHLTGAAGFDHQDVHLSYLPLAHSFERAVCYSTIAFSAAVGFFRGVIPELFDDIAELRPTFLVGAPRVWTRLHDKLQMTIKTGGWLKQTLFNKGFEWKKHYMSQGKKTPLIDSIVFGKAKARLGGRVKWIMSGSAPLDPALGNFLRIVFCCRVVEGYGLTENFAGAVVTDLDETKLGRVGKPFCCTEVKLVDVPEMNYSSANTPPTGEVMLRGGNVFKGYYKDEKKTKEELMEDGWFHTGDIGRWNDDGTLSIIDRKKNIFKLAQGEYVAVEYLEGIYIRSQFAGQVWVYGNSFKRFLIAVVVPDFDVLRPTAASMGVSGDNKALCENEKINELIFKDMTAEAKSAGIHGFEYIKAVHLTEEAFTVDNDLLTPTFKLKRPQLLKAFQSQVDAMYAKIGE